MQRSYGAFAMHATGTFIMRKILLASVAALGMTAAASAQDDAGSVYVGAGAGLVNIDLDTLGDANFGGVSLTGGYNISDYIGVEVEGLIGVGDDTVLGVDVGLNYLVSGYVVGRIPMGESGSNIFGRVGYGTAEFDVAGTDVSSDGFSYGVGGEWTPDGANFIRADATVLDEDSVKVGASYIRRF